jgi:hypothetical protein
MPPVRHRASARALVFGAGPRCSTLAARYRSHAIRSPRPLPSLCFRRSSRALWSPLLASLSSFVVMPTARSSLCALRVPGVGEAPQIAAIAEVGRSPPGPLRFRFFSLGFSLRGRPAFALNRTSLLRRTSSKGCSNFRCQTICARSRYHVETFSLSCLADQSPLSKRPASFVGSIFRACGLSRLLHPWPSHNIRNPSPCLIGWLPSPKGPLPPGHHFAVARSSSGLRSVVRSHGRCAQLRG